MTSNEYAIKLDCEACKPNEAENSCIIDSWTGVLRRVHWPVSLTKPNNQKYSANLKRINCGPLSLIIYSSDPIIAEREGRMSSSGNESHFTFNYINKGRLAVNHNNRISVLSKGDFMIADNSLPSTIEFLTKSQTFSIRIPGKLLGNYIDNPELLCNQMPACRNLYSRVLKELFFCLWMQCEDGATEESQKAVINSFLSFLATSFETPNRKLTFNTHKSEFLLSRIKEYIDKNLSNIHLSPELVAQEFHISTRYLRKLFQAEGTNSMSDYIRYKRLEKCAEDLIRTQPEKRSITDIAYFWGFNNSSSFTRTFKAYFGISPMEYKRR